MLKKIKDFFFIFKKINRINQKKPKYLFYSENKSYLKFGYLIIEYLAKKFPGEVYYVSSDVDDKINNLDVINVHISSGFLLQYFFTSVSAENLFMTLTDLNNSIIKKNKFVKNYIYYFHGAVSTTKSILQLLLIITIQYYVMAIIKLRKFNKEINRKF